MGIQWVRLKPSDQKGFQCGLLFVWKLTGAAGFA